MTLETAYLEISAVVYLGFAFLFLFLHLKQRSKFLKYFAIAWRVEAFRLAFYLTRSSGIQFSNGWFALPDILYLLVTWLLLSASASFVGHQRLSRPCLGLYFGLSIPLILGNYFLLKPNMILMAGQKGPPEIFYAIFSNLLVMFLPGGIACLWAMIWFFDYWKRTQMPGVLMVVLFFFLRGLDSLSLPVQWYFSYFPAGSYLTRLLETLGLSVGIVVVSLNKQRAGTVIGRDNLSIKLANSCSQPSQEMR